MRKGGAQHCQQFQKALLLGDPGAPPPEVGATDVASSAQDESNNPKSSCGSYCPTHSTKLDSWPGESTWRAHVSSTAVKQRAKAPATSHGHNPHLPEPAASQVPSRCHWEAAWRPPRGLSPGKPRSCAGTRRSAVTAGGGGRCWDLGLPNSSLEIKAMLDWVFMELPEKAQFTPLAMTASGRTRFTFNHESAVVSVLSVWSICRFNSHQGEIYEQSKEQ